jgi:hypothetical protein
MIRIKPIFLDELQIGSIVLIQKSLGRILINELPKINEITSIESFNDMKVNYYTGIDINLVQLLPGKKYVGRLQKFRFNGLNPLVRNRISFHERLFRNIRRVILTSRKGAVDLQSSVKDDVSHLEPTIAAEMIIKGFLYEIKAESSSRVTYFKTFIADVFGKEFNDSAKFDLRSEEGFYEPSLIEILKIFAMSINIPGFLLKKGKIDLKWRGEISYTRIAKNATGLLRFGEISKHLEPNKTKMICYGQLGGFKTTISKEFKEKGFNVIDIDELIISKFMDEMSGIKKIEGAFKILYKLNEEFVKWIREKETMEKELIICHTVQQAVSKTSTHSVFALEQDIPSDISLVRRDNPQVQLLFNRAVMVNNASLSTGMVVKLSELLVFFTIGPIDITVV